MTTVTRDGQRTVPTCPVCECRLTGSRYDFYTHYSYSEETDARGCRCPLLSRTFLILDNKVVVWSFT